MSGYAWAFFIAMAWLIGRVAWRHRKTLGLIGQWIPRRLVCVVRRHVWGRGLTVRVNPDSDRSYFSAFEYRCLRCHLFRRVRLNPSAAAGSETPHHD